MNNLIKSESAGNDNFSRVRYGDMEYEFTAFLFNPDSGGQAFILRPEAIIELMIEDDINDHSHTGYVILDNTRDHLERPPIEGGSTYLFRGDARDVFRFILTPVLNPDQITTQNQEKVRELMTLNFDFIVYDIEDYFEGGSKRRKLYFHDLFKQLLGEQGSSFSTAKFITNAAYLNNEDRGLNTGIILSKLIEGGLSKEDGLSTSFINFDTGSTKLFYSSPVDYRVTDCIQYVLSKHVSSQQNNFDKCILRIERYTRKWSLISLAEYFSRAYRKSTDSAGDLFLENYLLEGLKDRNTKTLNATVKRAPTYAPYLANNAILSNYSFIPSSGLTQQAVIGSAVSSYGHKNKAFRVDMQETSFERLAEVYKQNYVAPMKGEKGSPSSNLYPNKYRVDQKNIDLMFSTSEYNPQQRLGIGRSDSLKDALMLNSTISFTAPGVTYRQSCRFIGVDRNDDSFNCTFDDKMLGIYFIVNTKHIIKNNTYTNSIVAIKSSDYRDIKFVGNYV